MWVWFVLVHDLLALGVVAAFRLPETALSALVLANPASTFRVLVLSGLGTTGGGFGSVLASTGLSTPLLVAALAAWCVLPVAAASLLVGQLSPAGETANHIGKANAARFAASIVGTLSAGALYQAFGFDVIFGLLVGLTLLAFAGVALFCPPDDTRSEFAFLEMALNRRLLRLTSFRAPYAVAVTLVRTWVPIYAGVSAAKGGLAYAAFAVSVVIAAEKATNMVCQPYTGRLSDRFGRASFVFAGGAAYGLVALAVPSAPTAGAALDLPASYGPLGELSAAFLPLVGLNAALGIADSFREPASMALFADEGADSGGVASSFGVRELVWRPGSVVAPVVGGFLMVDVSMASVFYVGGGAAVVAAVLFLVVLLAGHETEALRAW